ncbi:PstC family ABC transporter permease [Mycoplasma sp. SG1]|uniref:PstC family ABC transporter permease n=1 Tax=Mycoplasma sp. SG1 TaxID=2810348 RepID=UPI0020242CF7|nr:ABC transporter permease subunit [Mycoplasma sp. SG1]URM52780.1 ABC transporter permease subunit [Mycoplasma sp. SG1]
MKTPPSKLTPLIIPSSFDRYHQYLKVINHIFKTLVWFFIFLSLAIVIGIIIFIFVYGVNGFGSIFSSNWDPSTNHFGILPFLIGTITTTIIAVLVALPLSIGFSLFIYDYCSKPIKTILFSIIQFLSGIPSIVFGLLGLTILVPIFNLSLFTAGLVLAIMITPIISTFIIISLSAIPQVYKDSAYALGASKIEVNYKIVFLMIKPGIYSGFLMGIGRAVGETMAVSMVIGGAVGMPNWDKFWSQFLGGSGSTITNKIFNDILEALGQHKTVLYTFAFILILVVGILNFSVIFIQKKSLKFSHQHH